MSRKWVSSQWKQLRERTRPGSKRAQSMGSDTPVMASVVPDLQMQPPFPIAESVASHQSTSGVVDSPFSASEAATSPAEYPLNAAGAADDDGRSSNATAIGDRHSLASKESLMLPPAAVPNRGHDAALDSQPGVEGVVAQEVGVDGEQGENIDIVEGDDVRRDAGGTNESLEIAHTPFQLESAEVTIAESKSFATVAGVTSKTKPLPSLSLLNPHPVAEAAAKPHAAIHDTSPPETGLPPVTEPAPLHNEERPPVAIVEPMPDIPEFFRDWYLDNNPAGADGHDNLVMSGEQEREHEVSAVGNPAHPHIPPLTTPEIDSRTLDKEPNWQSIILLQYLPVITLVVVMCSVSSACLFMFLSGVTIFYVQRAVLFRSRSV